MTPDQIIREIIYAYNETLSEDPELAEAGIDGFMSWAWSDDEPLRSYDTDRDTYRDCLERAYAKIHA